MTRERMQEILKNCFRGDIKITRAEALELVKKANTLKQMAKEFEPVLDEIDFTMYIYNNETGDEDINGNSLVVDASRAYTECEIID